MVDLDEITDNDEEDVDGVSEPGESAYVLDLVTLELKTVTDQPDTSVIKYTYDGIQISY